MVYYLEPSQVPPHLRLDYKGKKFEAQVCDRVVVPVTANRWESGSRESYRVIQLSTGAASPLLASTREYVRPLMPGEAVVVHRMFCGRDMGLRFYMLPEDVAKSLPKSRGAELTQHMRLVLAAAATLKASYGGRDRYDMMQDDFYRWRKTKDEAYPTRAQWDYAFGQCVAGKFLNAAGAITTAGRNALEESK